MTASPWDGVDQHLDEEGAGNPWFYLETYLEFHKGLEALLQELERHQQTVQQLGLAASPYEEEVDYLRGMVAWGKERIEAIKGARHATITVNGVSYGSLRYLKAGILYIAYLVEKQKAAFLAKNKVVPRSVLRSFDARVEQLRSMGEMGKLSRLKPSDVLFELTDASPQHVEVRGPALVAALPSPESGTEFAIVDPTLRKRCLPILRAIDGMVAASGEQQFDTVIREVSVILEDRVREVAGYTGKASGADLFSITMAREPVMIRFSTETDVQEAAHLFFRGYSGLVRNEVMHRLVPTYARERVIQLVCTVDYLLYLLSNTQVSSQSTNANAR